MDGSGSTSESGNADDSGESGDSSQGESEENKSKTSSKSVDDSSASGDLEDSGESGFFEDSGESGESGYAGESGPPPGTFVRFQRLRVVFLHRKHLQVSFKVGDEWSTFVVPMYIPYNSENKPLHV